VQNQESASILSSTDQLVRQARLTLYSFWFPLAVFGVLDLASAPLGEQAGGVFAAIYWPLAVTLGFVACVIYYRRRAARTGLEPRLSPGAMSALAIFMPTYLLGASAGPVRIKWSELFGPISAVLAGLAFLLVAAALALSIVRPAHGYALLSAATGVTMITGALIFKRLG
jgi:hypothetical protein